MFNRTLQDTLRKILIFSDYNEIKLYIMTYKIKMLLRIFLFFIKSTLLRCLPSPLALILFAESDKIESPVISDDDADSAPGSSPKLPRRSIESDMPKSRDEQKCKVGNPSIIFCFTCYEIPRKDNHSTIGIFVKIMKISSVLSLSLSLILGCW